MASFEILLGGRRPVRAASDAAEVRPGIGERAAIDILVDGANVSARSAPDDPVALVRGLVHGVDSLSCGRATTVRVPFHEGPWEICLARRGDDALVTFLRCGASPEVVVMDRPVPLRCVAEAAVRAARRIGPVRGEGLEALATDALEHAASPSIVPSVDESTRIVHAGSWARPPALEDGTAFGLSLRLPAGDSGTEADLYPLLLSGELVLWHLGRRHRVAEGLVFLHLDRLVRLVRATLEAYERRRPCHVRLQADGLLVAARLGPKALVELSFSGAGRKDPLVLPGLAVRDLARAVWGLARAFRRAASAGPACVRRNFRIAEISAEARRLSSLARDLAPSASVLCAQPDAYRGLIPFEEDLDDAGTDAGGPALGAARRIRFAERWRLEADGLDLASVLLCGDRLLASTTTELLAVHRDRGDMLWRRHLAPAALQTRAGQAGLARLHADGRLVLHGFEDGEARWETRLEPRAGAPPFARMVAPPDAPPMLLVAEGLRRLCALDLRTGERRWRHTARRGGLFRASTAGVLTFVVSGDSALTALETATGRIAWRIGERARFSEPPLVMREAVVAAAALGDDATVVAGVEAASGRLLWRRIVEGRLVGMPRRVGAAVALRLAIGPGTAVLVLDPATGTTAWRGVLGASPDDVRVLGTAGALFASTSTGHVIALDATGGKERWRVHLPARGGRPAPRVPMLVPCGDALFVGSDAVHLLAPDDGRVLHRLPDDSPVPDLLRVDERGTTYIGETGGTLACWALTAALRVVSTPGS